MEPSTERAARAEQNLKDRYTFGVAAHRLSCKQYALVAQSAEHRTFNARVRSSSLRRRTTPPWPDSQAVKTPPFHGFKSRSGHQYVQVAELADAPGSNPGSLCGIVGSIPTLDTMRRHMARFYVARSSVG